MTTPHLPAASPSLNRWLYTDPFPAFLARDPAHILGQLSAASVGPIEQAQVRAWQQQIPVLKAVSLPLALAPTAKLYLEYTVPRLGRRADAILIVGPALFVLEFKVGEQSFLSADIDQVWDYALDLKLFHDASHTLPIVPLLIATEAKSPPIQLRSTVHDDRLVHPICVGSTSLSEAIQAGLDSFGAQPLIDASRWEAGRYLPTPTIVEAARALYAGHAVETISRSDAGALNLATTSKAVDQIIDEARSSKQKVICFVTGVPGAGKTLVGLDVANRHLDKDSATYSVFLSGNGPLVAVLREALARDRVERATGEGKKLRKGDARKEVEAFIQNIHHFRDEYLTDQGAPPEHVVLFDEAQRAWNLAKTETFMKERGLANFGRSEPAFLISCMDRHADWAVIVCLVGGGQEINTGEAGISEWFDAILTAFPNWRVCVSPQLTESEYRSNASLAAVLDRGLTTTEPRLHLATSMRSFRAESLSRFVRDFLDLEVASARQTLESFAPRYPIRLTRRLDVAKRWLREQARGSERYGMIVSSQAERLKPHAIDVRVKTDPVKWFLDGKDDTRSSYYLEDVATEFQVQGLELDWACLVWDADLRRSDRGWSHHSFRGTRWNRINMPERQRYLENAYRVLLTRARQGMIVVVPEGDEADPTRLPEFYDTTYQYLAELGIEAI